MSSSVQALLQKAQQQTGLVALHEGARFLSRWELMAPTPPPETATVHVNPRRLEVMKSIDALRGTDLQKMHRVEAGGRAQPRQLISDHGYTRQQVESDPVLASYIQRYQVVLEPTRNTG